MILDNALSLRFPADCTEIKGEQRDKLQTIIESDSNAFFQFKLKTLFKSPGGIFVIVNRILGASDVFNALDEKFENFLRDSFMSDKITRGQFSVNDIDVIQFLITTNETVAFKLFCRADQSFYQIDYFIPQKIYENNLKSIESSIGTLKTNNTKRR